MNRHDYRHARLTGMSGERVVMTTDWGWWIHAAQASGVEDITVFDPATLADPSTWESGRVSPSGIVHVLVNCELVVTEGRPTGSLPGRIVGRS